MITLQQTISVPRPAMSPQQRTHERVAVKVAGVLRIPETRSGTYLVTVLDASKTGLRISCPSTIAAGMRVEVRVKGAIILGVARYSRDVDREFHVGIEADGVENTNLHAPTTEFDLTLLLGNSPASFAQRS